MSDSFIRVKIINHKSDKGLFKFETSVLESFTVAKASKQVL